jgi:hypothetical protein
MLKAISFWKKLQFVSHNVKKLEYEITYNFSSLYDNSKEVLFQLVKDIVKFALFSNDVLITRRKVL